MFLIVFWLWAERNSSLDEIYSSTTQQYIGMLRFHDFIANIQQNSNSVYNKGNMLCVCALVFEWAPWNILKHITHYELTVLFVHGPTHTKITCAFVTLYEHTDNFRSSQKAIAEFGQTYEENVLSIFVGKWLHRFASLYSFSPNIEYTGVFIIPFLYSVQATHITSTLVLSIWMLWFRPSERSSFWLRMQITWQ